MNIIAASVSRTRMVVAILLMIFVAGTAAWISIPKESNPDINIPIMYVSMHLEGVSPEDSERLLIRPMEKELASIEGVKEMRSSGYLGGGFVLLEFDAGFDADQALEDVQKATDKAKAELPAEADEPEVSEVNFSLFPVLVVTLSGNVAERALVHLARDLQDRMEALEQVLEVNITGNREDQVEVVVDPLKIEALGLNGAEIIEFFRRSNKLVAAGNMDTGTGRFAVKVPGLFRSADELLDMPVKTVGDSVIRIRDVAEIRRTYKDPENFARINGKPAVALNVVKRTGENIIDTIAAVRTIVESERAYWPKDVQVHYTLDQSNEIRVMLNDLSNNLLSAIILVMIVTIMTLGLRSSLIVGVSIPGSFLLGIMILQAMGLTINVVVLFSLILTAGIVVDGATVVIEYADRKMAEGIGKREAYLQAAERMGWPIVASILTTLAAFFPLLFWPGVSGEFMKYMPITIIAVLLASLVNALIFIPVMGALFGKVGSADATEQAELAQAEHGDVLTLRGVTGGYVRLLDRAIRRPFLVVVSMLAVLVGIQWYYANHGNGVQFFPDIEPDFATVLIHGRGNLSVMEQDALVKQVEARIFDVKGIDLVYTQAGGQARQGSSDVAADVIGQITLEFAPWQERPKAQAILDEIRVRTADVKGIHVETREMQGGPPTGKAVQIELSSREPDILPAAVATVRAALAELGDFRDIEDTLPLPGIEWELVVDRTQASKFGVDLDIIGSYVRMVTNGLKVADYRPNDTDDEVDMVIRYPVDARTLDRLDRIRIVTPQGPVPISNFVKRVPKAAVGSIDRVDQRRAVTVKADLPPDINTAAKTEAVKAWMTKNAAKLDPRVRVTFKGEDEEQREAQEFLGKAFIGAMFLIAIILLTQFNSIYSTLLILSAVIMSTIGVFIGLIVTGQAFGVIMTGIGVIALAGVIVSNNIVLIDTFDQLYKREGKPLREAILRTGALRLRPVFLTQITTVLGLIPMMFQVNIDFITREISTGAPSTQWWVQLSTAIVFGLTFATILTLVFTPCALMLRHGFKERGWPWKRKKAEVSEF